MGRETYAQDDEDKQDKDVAIGRLSVVAILNRSIHLHVKRSSHQRQEGDNDQQENRECTPAER